MNKKTAVIVAVIVEAVSIWPLTPFSGND